MYHYHHRRPADSAHKDVYISELKAENFELRHRQGAHYNLKERIAGTEYEIAAINEERRQIEDEMKVRKAQDDHVIRGIQVDNDGLRGAIGARDAEIAELKAKIEALRYEDADLTDAIKNVSNDINAISDHNADLRNDIHELDDQLGHEKSLGRNLRMDLDKAKTVHASSEHAIRLLEDDLRSNKLNEDDLNRILADKTAELNNKTARLRALEDDIAALKANIDGRDRELHDLNRKYSIQLDMTNKERADLDRNLARNAELEMTVRRLESELADLEDEIAHTRAEVDRLSGLYNEATVANKDLESELEALNRHAQLLESQNVDLTKELDAIVVADERVRADLDRRHRVTTLQKRNDDEMKNSILRMAFNRHRSPVRSYSRSPTRRY